ncbi:MAG: hypothetical protein IJ379_04265 [Lachnospiraceae bacterium]|nr:hypothetical protein [Lachnospiraceae bacterium]
MYNVVKNVIGSKNYELKDMLNKLDKLWVQGGITEEQHTELISLAQNNAKVENSIDILRMLKEMDKRITALENAKETIEGEDTETVTYPEYETGKWYYAGDKISFNGNNYICIAPDGAVCVWSPAEYPAYWELITDETAESNVEEI